MHAKKIAFIGIFAALAVVLSLVAIPYPLVPFLKFDLSEIVIFIAVSTVGFVPALFIALLTAILNFFVLGPVGPFAIGQIALFLSGVIIAASYTLFYKKFKWRPLPSFILTALIFTLAITTLNYFWITPTYFGIDYQTALATVSLLEFGLNEAPVFISPYLTATLLVYIPFNLLKMVFIGAGFFAIRRTLVNQIEKFI
ncbi:MAG: ECF transporter S component [Culicoidibacterales bacterium]